MNFKHTLIAILAGACSLYAGAETIIIDEPGTLAELMADNASVTTLSIDGKVNAADFDFINNKLTELTDLDLSKATIMAYRGAPVLFNNVDFPADCLPAYALAGTGIATVTLPSGLTAIGEGALSSSAIAVIDLAACPALAAIGDGAFSNCHNLTEVTIPASVTGIGAHAFSRCSNLTRVSAVACDIPALAFAFCPLLEEVTFSPNGTRSIGDSAFLGCASLKTISLPRSLTSIGVSAFEATGLTSVDMQATRVATIGDWAFAKCPALENVMFSDFTNTFGKGLFFEDKALVTVSIPADVTELPDYIFKGSNQVDTTNFIHCDIASIGNYAFKDMDHVTTFTLPANLAYIGDEGMAGWTSLQILNAESLTQVPELGADVWNGVNQEDVHLVVSHDLSHQFDTTEQWKEFHIDVSSGIDDVTADQEVARRIKAWFDGTLLHIRADGELADVRLHDLSGRNYLSRSPRSAETTIDTADFTERVYIVTVRLADGTPATIKIAR